MGCGPSTPSAAAVSPSPNVRPPPPTEEEKVDTYTAKMEQRLKLADELLREAKREKDECEDAQIRAK